MDKEVKEITFYRVIEDLREKLKELAAFNVEIRVQRERSSPEFIMFISNDVMDKVKTRASEMMKKMEAIFEDQHTKAESTKNMDIKLPRIVISTFSGSYLEWQRFMILE